MLTIIHRINARAACIHCDCSSSVITVHKLTPSLCQSALQQRAVLFEQGVSFCLTACFKLDDAAVQGVISKEEAV
eukprot:2722495-Amphidinium_carterae.2